MNKKPSTVSSVQFVDITADHVGQRVDNFLIKTLKNLPRSRLYRIIRKGEVRVNKKRVKPEYKLSLGDTLRIPPIHLEEKSNEAPTIPDALLAQLESSILFENDQIMVINKPSGLAVHTGSGLRFGAVDAIRELRKEDTIELVHRLDRDTSGCLLLAKSRASLLVMQKLLQSNEMSKYYQAIVKGHWNKSLDHIDLPLLKRTMSNGEKKVFVDDRGQKTSTRIEGIQHFTQQNLDYSLLTIKLLTGRTHQIRVHCQSQHHEIVGDPKYGDRKFNQRMKILGSKRLLLHAVKLEIPKNAHTKALQIIAPEPREFKGLI